MVRANIYNILDFRILDIRIVSAAGAVSRFGFGSTKMMRLVVGPGFGTLARKEKNFGGIVFEKNFL
jgi:hypothetical protein